MQAALQQNSRAAELQHFLNFFVDGFERQDVAVLGAQRPVKCAERAILGAEIGVIDVAVDLIGDHTRIVLLQAQPVRFHADADEVIGLQHLERLLFGYSHGKLLIVPWRQGIYYAPRGFSNSQANGRISAILAKSRLLAVRTVIPIRPALTAINASFVSRP